MRQHERFYEKTEDGVKCTLCPHFCIIKPGSFGKCLSRKATEDEIFLDSYSKVTTIACEPIEKKPFLHFLPGDPMVLYLFPLR